MGNCIPSKEAGDPQMRESMMIAKFANPISDLQDSIELVQCCGDGDAKAVQALLDDGASPDSEDDGNHGTALMVAATHGHADVLEVLLKAGATVDLKHEDFGMTALLWACHSAHVRCVELLLAAGADKDATEATGLNGKELAKENMRLGWERVVDLLRDGEIMSTSKDYEEERALSEARNKRMQRILGDESDAGFGGMQYLQTSEMLDKKPDVAPALKPRALTLQATIDEEGESDGSPKTMQRNKSRRNIIKGLAADKDENETQEYIQRWGVDGEVSQLVGDYLAKARNSDKTVTPLLRKMAKSCNGTLYGLDFRIKSKASLTRKILEKTKGDASKLDETLRMQNDALRYTILFPTAEYVAGVQEVERVFAANQINGNKMKNFWRKPGEEADYMGINAIYKTPNGFPFELQYHTQESIDTKMQRCHHSYEKFREDHSMVKAQYWEEMVRMWSLVPIPDGVQRLGKLVVHEVDIKDALASLSVAELDAIAAKKKLEDTVKPMCAWVTAHTLKAESNVTPILIELAKQNSVALHGLDFRVKSGLSMTRKIVNQLHNENKTHNDEESVEAAVWCEQRQALRYTLVIDPKVYKATCEKCLAALSALGFVQEICWNYWLDAEPYNAIRTRMWSSELQSWCFLVFHTQESLEMSEARLTHYQQSMGMVIQTATFDDAKKLEAAVEDLLQDESWTERVAGMTIPDGVSTLGKIIKTERNLHPLITKTTAVGAFMNPTAFMNPKANFPAHVHSPLEEGELAEQDGKVAKAINSYTDGLKLLDALVSESLAASGWGDSTDTDAARREEMERYKGKHAMLNAQFEARSVVMTAVTDYIWIVRLQHRWIRNHPRSAAVTKAAAAAKAVEVKANKKGKMGKKIKPDKKLNKKRSME